MNDVEETVSLLLNVSGRCVSEVMDLIFKGLQALVGRNSNTYAQKETGKFAKLGQDISKHMDGIGSKGEVSMKKLREDGSQLGVVTVEREDLVKFEKALKERDVTFAILQNSDGSCNVLFKAPDYDVMANALQAVGIQEFGISEEDIAACQAVANKPSESLDETLDIPLEGDMTPEQEEAIASLYAEDAPTNNIPTYDKAYDKLSDELKAKIDSDDPGYRLGAARRGEGLDKLINDDETLIRGNVAMQGYGLDKLINDGDQTVVDCAQTYLDEHDQTIDEWIEQNPEKCALPENQTLKEDLNVESQQANSPAENRSLNEAQNVTQSAETGAQNVSEGEQQRNVETVVTPMTPEQAHATLTQDGEHFGMNWSRGVDGEMRAQAGIYDIQAREDGSWKVSSAGEKIAAGTASNGAISGAMIAGACTARDIVHKEQLMQGVEFQKPSSPTHAVGVGDKTQAAQTQKNNISQKNTIASWGAEAKAHVAKQREDKPKEQTQKQNKGIKH